LPRFARNDTSFYFSVFSVISVADLKKQSQFRRLYLVTRSSQIELEEIKWRETGD